MMDSRIEKPYNTESPAQEMAKAFWGVLKLLPMKDIYAIVKELEDRYLLAEAMKVRGL